MDDTTDADITSLLSGLNADTEAGRFALEVNYPKLSQVLKLEIGNLQFVLLNIFKSLHNHSAKVALQDKMIEDLRAQLRDKIDKETGIPRIAELERKMDALHENLKKWLAPTVAKCDGHQIKIKNAEAAIDTLKGKIDMVDRRLLGKHEELFFFQIIDARPGIRRPNMLAQKHIADEDLRHALVDRLQYYREYRVKDLSDGNICHFKRGTVIDGAFVMLMSLARAELVAGSDDVRCYRLDKKDASGRDVFKKVSILEAQAIKNCPPTWADQYVDINGAEERVAFVTEIECQGRFFAVFNSESLYRRLRMLEARFRLLESEGFLDLAHARHEGEGLEVADLRRQVAAAVARIQDDLTSAQDRQLQTEADLNLVQRHVQHVEQGIVDGTIGTAPADPNPHIDQQLHDLEVDISGNGHRVARLEMLMKQVLTLNSRDDVPASADDHYYAFYEKKSVDGIITSVHTEDEPISDSVRKQALSERMRYYQQYRIKDLTDGQVMSFVKGFVLDSHFYMQMQQERDHSQYKIYRLDRKDEYGRDVFKNVVDEELALINGTELGWAKKIIQVDGKSVQAMITTELEFHGKFYTVFQVLKAATLEDAVTNLQHSVGTLEQNLEVSTALYRQKLHEVASKLEHIQHIPQRRFSPHRRVEDLY